MPGIRGELVFDQAVGVKAFSILISLVISRAR
jgi:hypothetical protein